MEKDMLTLDQSLKAIITGVHNANNTYIKWSGGSGVSDYGIEALISSKIAESIHDSVIENSGFVTLETSFSQLWDACKSKVRGRKPNIIRPTRRADIVYWGGDSMPVGVVEVKRRFEYSSSEEDIERTCKLLEKLGKENGGKLKWGCVASFRPQYSNNVKDAESILADFVSKCKLAYPDFKFSGQTFTETLDYPAPLYDGTELVAHQAYAVIFRRRRN